MEATSLSQVCGFIATIRSQPPRRPTQPLAETRTSNQVGRPWMFEGKMLRVAMGTPMRRMERANNSFADAEPEPFTLANLTTKSLVDLIGLDMAAGLGRIEEEFLHVPGAGRAAFGAQSAMQAKVLVLRHDPARLQPFRQIQVLGIRMG